MAWILPHLLRGLDNYRNLLLDDPQREIYNLSSLANSMTVIVTEYLEHKSNKETGFSLGLTSYLTQDASW